MNAVNLLLLAGAILLWILSMVSIGDLHSSDAAGNGLALAFGAFALVGLWVLLALLLVLSAMKGGWPAWARWAAFLVVPACAVASFVAVDLLKDTFYVAKWPIIVPAAGPILLAAYAMCAYLPSLRVFSTGTGGLAIWAMVLMLSVAPWPEYLYRLKHRAEDLAKADAAHKAGEPQRVEAARKAHLDALNKLSPDSPLREWLEFTGPEDELRQEAFQRIRHLGRRQSDAETLFRQGYTYLQRDLAELGLEATPPVCDGSLRYFKEKLDDIRPRSSDPPPFENIQEFILPYMPGLAWMVQHKCDCTGILDDLEKVIRPYSISPARTQFLARIVELRAQPSGKGFTCSQRRDATGAAALT